MLGYVLYCFSIWSAQDALVTAEDFTLADEKGGQIVLSEQASSGAVVLVFIGTDCPVTQRYAPRLESLRQSFEPRGVHFLGISSNVQDSQAEVLRFGRDYDIHFPLLKDVSGQIASRLGAQRTPEVFVIDKQRLVRYRGRIDDQFDDDSDRSLPTRPDLEIALEEVLDGRDVTVPNTRVHGCRIGRALAEMPNASVTWHSEIAELFRKHCINCHRAGGAGPFPLSRYEDVEGWAETIREAVADRRMPPWYASADEISFSNDFGLSEQDRSIIAKWVNDGSPRGDATEDDYSPPPSSNWQIASEPDQVLSMSASPVEITAEGRQEYRYFLMNPDWKSNLLVKGVEIRPGNRRLVSQAAVFVIPPGLAGAYTNIRDLTSTSELDANLLAWYSAGSAPTIYPDDLAREIQAGSQLLFRLRYRPTGRKESDKTQLGLILADTSKVTRLVQIVPIQESAITLTGDVPAKEVVVKKMIDDGIFLLSITPSVTRFGRSFRLQLPPDSRDGSVASLLRVESLPYPWAHQYRLNLPLELSAGTELSAQGLFDRFSPADRKRGEIPDAEELDSGSRNIDERLVTYLEIAPPPPPPIAAVPLPLLDPTQNISMAIGGLAFTLTVCLCVLWLKPVTSATRPAEPPPPLATEPETPTV
jgi:peroxiredoxin/mono/diheme cytochrome c family protein